MWRLIRISVLLVILVFVAINTLTEQRISRSWRAPVQVALYPINADGSAAASHFVQAVSSAELNELNDFFVSEAREYALPLQQPFRFVWGAPLPTLPPLPPNQANRLAIMAWSLKLRWFRWRTPNPPGPTPMIKLYVLFHDSATNTPLPDSTGLSKGLVGLAHVFADPNMRRANLVVIAHELLHTLTATDKYDLTTRQPLDPEGLAEPDAQPRYPQRYAELMAGRIALSAHTATQANSLAEVLIGPRTAAEIGWSAP